MQTDLCIRLRRRAAGCMWGPTMWLEYSTGIRSGDEPRAGLSLKHSEKVADVVSHSLATYPEPDADLTARQAERDYLENPQLSGVSRDTSSAADPRRSRQSCGPSTGSGASRRRRASCPGTLVKNTTPDCLVLPRGAWVVPGLVQIGERGSRRCYPLVREAAQRSAGVLMPFGVSQV